MSSSLCSQLASLEQQISSQISSWLQRLNQSYGSDLSLCRIAFVYESGATSRQLSQKIRQDLEISPSLSFPQLEISISHSSHWGIGVCLSNSQGTGIDLQCKKNISPRLRKRISNQNFERESSVETLKLWSIKEALFKANISNKNTFLKDYCLIDDSLACIARSKYFEYALWNWEYFYLACAVRVVL